MLERIGKIICVISAIILLLLGAMGVQRKETKEPKLYSFEWYENKGVVLTERLKSLIELFNQYNPGTHCIVTLHQEDAPYMLNKYELSDEWLDFFCISDEETLDVTYMVLKPRPVYEEKLIVAITNNLQEMKDVYKFDKYGDYYIFVRCKDADSFYDKIIDIFKKYTD